MTAAADGPMLRVQRVRSSHRQVAEQLRELIVAGELSPSDRLPSELRMAELFGVSRSTIREALRSLVADGIVETRRGVRGGTFVVDRNIQDLEAALIKALQTLAARAAGGSGDLLEMWEAIEAAAAGRAATVADASQIALLNDLSLPTEEDSLDSEILDRLAEFHYAVLRASSSPLLEAIGRPLATVATIRLVRPTTPREFWDGISADHRAIAKAIADRDAQRASRLTGSAHPAPPRRDGLANGVADRVVERPRPAHRGLDDCEVSEHGARRSVEGSASRCRRASVSVR